MASSYIQYNQAALATPFDNSTNGFIANNVQSAIEEVTRYLNDSELVATSTVTTSSSTDSLLNAMTITPPAGTYMVWFIASMICNSSSQAISSSFYVGGVQDAATLQKIAPFDGGLVSATEARGMMCLLDIVSVNGTQAIEVRWSVSGGTATCGPRTMTLLRVG